MVEKVFLKHVSNSIEWLEVFLEGLSNSIEFVKKLFWSNLSFSGSKVSPHLYLQLNLNFICSNVFRGNFLIYEEKYVQHKFLKSKDETHVIIVQ